MTMVQNHSGRPLVLGVGNILMGDEGVGIHAAQLLERELAGRSVDVVDGGTGGFTLLPLFQTYSTIILLDATMDGNPPGSVAIREPRFASDYPRSLSAHDLGLRDLIECSAVLSYSPKVYLLTVSVESVQPVGIALSPEVASALPRLLSSVHDLLRQLALNAA